MTRKMAFLLMFFAALCGSPLGFADNRLTSGPAQSREDTVSVGSWLAKRKEIDQLNLEVKQWKLKVQRAKLINEFKNVGKEKSDDSSDSQKKQPPPYMPFQAAYSSNAQLKDPKKEAEEKRKERLNAALNNAMVSKVMPGPNHRMMAYLILPGGNVSVEKGDQIGNWVIDGVTLGGVTTHNKLTHEHRSIPTVAEVTNQ